MKTRVVKPSQEQLKAYLMERRATFAPPPSPDEICRRLGWTVVLSNEAVMPRLRIGKAMALSNLLLGLWAATRSCATGLRK